MPQKLTLIHCSTLPYLQGHTLCRLLADEEIACVSGSRVSGSRVSRKESVELRAGSLVPVLQPQSSSFILPLHQAEGGEEGTGIT